MKCSLIDTSDSGELLVEWHLSKDEVPDLLDDDSWDKLWREAREAIRQLIPSEYVFHSLTLGQETSGGGVTHLVSYRKD